MRKLRLFKLRIRNKIFFDFVEDNFTVVLILLLFAMIGLWLWFRVDSLKDFGQNFVTEILGVLITVLIINQLIVIREERRKLPHKFAVYDDIRLYISSFTLFWQQAFQESVPEDDPENIYLFFSDDGISIFIVLLVIITRWRIKRNNDLI